MLKKAFLQWLFGLSPAIPNVGERFSLSCVDTLAHGDMGGSPDTTAKNNVMTDFFILFIGYVADYSKFRIFRPFQRVHRTKPGISHLIPPGQQYLMLSGVYPLTHVHSTNFRLRLGFHQRWRGSVIPHGTFLPYLSPLPAWHRPVARSGMCDRLIDQILQGFAGTSWRAPNRDMQRKVIPPPLRYFSPLIFRRHCLIGKSGKHNVRRPPP